MAPSAMSLDVCDLVGDAGRRTEVSSESRNEGPYVLALWAPPCGAGCEVAG